MPADRPPQAWSLDDNGKAHAVCVTYWNGTEVMACGLSLIYPEDATDQPRCPECERRVREERKP